MHPAAFGKKLIVEETSVVSHQHHGLDLLDGLKHDTYNDDQACSAERDRSVEEASENEGKDSHHGQTNCTDENNIIQDPVQVLAGGPAGTDTRDKAAALLEVVRDLDRVEGDRSVEICEEHQKKDVEQKT